MRKLVVTILTSLDGYVAGPGGDFMAMPLDESFSAYNLERLRTADTLLLGRTTFLGFRSYWPSVAHDPKQPDTEREISRRNTAAHKVVVSDSLCAVDVTGWGDSELVRRSDAHDAVRRLKAQDGGDILVFGSVPVYNDLLAAGLVDKLRLMVGNGILGDGVPAFTAGLPQRLRLRETRRLPGSDNVLLVYAVGDGEPTTPRPDSSDELTAVARFDLHPGRVEDFKRLSLQCMDIVRAEDTGTLQYDVYLDEDRAEAVVLERYRDSDALIEHLGNIGDDLMAAISATGSVVGETLGKPSAQLRTMLAGSPVRLLTPFLSM